MTATVYRYHLPQKAIKGDCPDCSPKHRRTLSRYVDDQTGEPIPQPYGRCDRESNCGYHLSPYHKGHSGMSYADEVYELSKAENARPTSAQPNRRTRVGGPVGPRPVDSENRLETRFLKTDSQQNVRSDGSATNLSTIENPVYTIPEELFTQSLGHYERNQFARLLHQQFGADIATQLLDRFQIGTSSRWPGACVFWYVDECGRKRGGQIKLFGEDWHTAKYVDRKGQTRNAYTWVHSVLLYRCKATQTAVPDWLKEYEQHGQPSPCLFGLPQLLTAPIDQPIAIVEAPKTAILCTAHFPQFLWLAVGGLSYLNCERLAPVKDRTIILFPDLSRDGKAHARWSQTATELRKQGFRIAVTDYLERHATDTDKEQGLDLADFLLRQPGCPLTSKLLKLAPVELLTVSPCDSYPAEWDALISDFPMLLISSPNREAFARILGVPPTDLPLYQIATPASVIPGAGQSCPATLKHVHFPPAPLAWNVEQQLQAIRWCVIREDLADVPADLLPVNTNNFQPAALPA